MYICTVTGFEITLRGSWVLWGEGKRCESETKSASDHGLAGQTFEEQGTKIDDIMNNIVTVV